MDKLQTSPNYRPLYEQIKVLITQSLIQGEWKPGESIPSEFDLAFRFKVSQGTVRKAIDSLANEKILTRRQGKGTFVATHEEEKIQLRFLRLTAEDGSKELLKNSLLSFTKSKADKEISKCLDIKVGTAIFVIKRVLTFSDRPLIYDHIVVPVSSFKGLNRQKIIEKQGSLYSLYETQYGIRMVRAEERLKAISADSKIAKILSVNDKDPLLSIERVSFTYGDKPMEWRLGLCITDDHHYRNELE